jgi:hypothetical protein
MAYPGSEWHYDDGSVETCDAWKICTVNGACEKLPGGSFGIIRGEDKVWKSASNDLFPVLRTIPGEMYFTQTQSTTPVGSHKVIEHTRYVVGLLDSMQVSGIFYHDIIHVRETELTYYTASQFPVPQSRIAWEYYYANDVGLIRSVIDSSEFQYPGPVMTRNLTSYTIGPH